MYASSRTTWPLIASARLEMPNHERITRSSRTAPVAGSTFSAPKKCWRAATVGLVAAAALPPLASTAAHASAPSHLILIARLPRLDLVVDGMERAPPRRCAARRPAA